LFLFAVELADLGQHAPPDQRRLAVDANGLWNGISRVNGYIVPSRFLRFFLLPGNRPWS
jgi:hypothetical protein